MICDKIVFKLIIFLYLEYMFQYHTVFKRHFYSQPKIMALTYVYNLNCICLTISFRYLNQTILSNKQILIQQRNVYTYELYYKKSYIQ